MGVSLWLSALYVLYRDVQYIIPFLVQIWMYLSLVMVPTSKIPHKWLWLLQPEPHDRRHRRFSLGAVRRAGATGLLLRAISALMVVVVFVSGLYYFRRMERVFADLV